MKALKKLKYFFFILFFTVLTSDLFAQNSEKEENTIILENIIETLRRYFSEETGWQITDSLVIESVNGLINFIQSEPVDTILSRLNKYLKEPGFPFVTLINNDVADSLAIPGYYSQEQLNIEIERISQQFNDSIFEAEYNQLVKQLVDSVKLNNYLILKSHNDSVIAAVNDTIHSALILLSNYANFIDSTKINIMNIFGDSYELMLNSQNVDVNRIWLKNEQNDSLSVLVRNLDNRTIQLLIGEGVAISRFRQRESRQFDFSSLNNNNANNFSAIGRRYAVETPWQLGTNTNVAFTQTHIGKYWKKGGQSALNLLIILKGNANYSRADGKVKWENSAEIRNGYIKPGGENSELQKNDDKFEVTSRFGVSAFKKWFYSTEINFETQFFRGYNYPTSKFPDPISSFLAPAKTFMKLGLDYKPNKDFSFLLSPITIKNVFVKDTVLINQTRFGIEKGKKSFWEPGLNTDITFRKELTKDIIYTTRYKMFINYLEPQKKYDINWENQLNFKLTSYINMQMMLHMIYDKAVLFRIYDNNGDPTGEEKPKLQIKQLATVSFTYNISRSVMRTRRIN